MMKKITQARIYSLSVCLFLVALLVMSSCSSPQHFTFSAAPPAYMKKVKPTVENSPEPATEANLVTASTTEAPVILPEIAKVSAEHKAALSKVAAMSKKEATAQPKQKLSLAQKVVMHKLQKQVTKMEREVTKTKDTQDTTAGPVSNRSAIALIIIGLIIALFGALLGSLFYTLGTLLILIGLVLLILNYI